MPTGEHNESKPKANQKPFKPTTEKLKKFDELVKEFPKNLVVPIDKGCLRKIARQEKSNRAKREKRRSTKEVEIHIALKGTDFTSVAFDMKDFQEK